MNWLKIVDSAPVGLVICNRKNDEAEVVLKNKEALRILNRISEGTAIKTFSIKELAIYRNSDRVFNFPKIKYRRPYKKTTETEENLDGYDLEMLFTQIIFPCMKDFVPKKEA